MIALSIETHFEILLRKIFKKYILNLYLSTYFTTNIFFFQNFTYFC